MKRCCIPLLLCCLAAAFGAARAQTGELPRAVPEDEGVPSQAVTALFDSLMALPDTEIHSVMVLRHGKVIGEIYPKPFDANYRHTVYSCSKTFVGAAVGLAIAENRLRLDDRVAAFFPAQLPDSVPAALADISVRHLLTMTSGITPDWEMRSLTPRWIETYLAKPVDAPGTAFQYDSMCSYLLSAIVQKVTGQTLLDYLRPRLFAPMGITEVGWEVSPEGINTGGWGLHIQSESLAKFGLLLLGGGRWQGKQLLPARWVEAMMTEQHPGTGYGFQMWQCEYPGTWRLDGALGQYVLIVPDKDMVVVITECTLINGIRQRNLVWHGLLPRLSQLPLPPDPEAYARLQDRQKNCTLPLLKGKAGIAPAARVEGKTFALRPNTLGWRSMQLSRDADGNSLLLSVTDDEGRTSLLHLGYNRWLESTLSGRPPYSIRPIDAFKGLDEPFHAAGCYARTARNVLQLKVHYVDWVSSLDITLTPSADGNSLHLAVKPNYASVAEEITGTAESPR